jgi:outer membrane protein assembly factor BamB
MKPLLSVLTLVLTAATAAAQPPRIYSRPLVPPREVLERLNLVLSWHAYVPVENPRDGVYSIQLTPRDMLVQTRSGLIASLDPETGQTHWRTMPGMPYRNKVPLGYNSRLVVAANGTHLYCFNRDTGAQLWTFDLPSAPIAAPVLDEDQLIVAIGGARMQVYLLAANPPPAPPGARKKGEAPAPAGPPPNAPTPTGIPPAPPPEEPQPPSGQVTGNFGPYGEHWGAPPPPEPPLPLALVYEQLLAVPLDRAPLLTSELLFMADRHGTLLGLSKSRQREVFHYDTGGPISAPFGQLGDTAYVASLDQNVYAFDLFSGRLLWRYTTSTPVYERPKITDADVYLSPAGSGLYRLARDSGGLVWRNPTAQHFLAANPKFVYATDRSGRLVVLDQRHGTLLSGYDTHDYTVSVGNDLTDRVYLAANDGLVVCLHDRAYPTPVSVRRTAAAPAAPFRQTRPLEKKAPAENPPADKDK